MALKKFNATKEELESAYLELQSKIKVAEHFGVSKKLILNYMKRYGIERIRPSSEESAEIIRPFVEQGLSAPEIAEKSGFSTVHIRLLAKILGAKLPDKFHTGHITTHNGYRMIQMPGHHDADSKGYVREHRFLMEQILGRTIDKNEVVHHKNGIKTDNRPENLEVMTKADHVKLHHTGKTGRGPDRKPRKLKR